MADPSRPSTIAGAMVPLPIGDGEEWGTRRRPPSHNPPCAQRGEGDRACQGVVEGHSRSVSPLHHRWRDGPPPHRRWGGIGHTPSPTFSKSSLRAARGGGPRPSGRGGGAWPVRLAPPPSPARRPSSPSEMGRNGAHAAAHLLKILPELCSGRGTAPVRAWWRGMADPSRPSTITGATALLPISDGEERGSYAPAEAIRSRASRSIVSSSSTVWTSAVICCRSSSTRSRHRSASARICSTCCGSAS